LAVIAAGLPRRDGTDAEVALQPWPPPVRPWLRFLSLWAYHAIAHAIGEIYAALVVGSGYFVASLIALLVLSFRNR
jgi:hypothetical protein